MSTEKIALLTYKDGVDLADGESLLPPAFKKVGIEAIATPWDGNINWDEYSTIILRACWNYHLDKAKFIQWLENQSNLGLKIWNPVEIVKWSTDKHYLLDLEKNGIPIIPTVILESEDTMNLKEILTKDGWESGVVKPVVGASAFKVERFNIENASEIESKLDRKNSWIVQKFCPEIKSKGEY